MNGLNTLAVQIEAFRVRLAIASLKNDALARNRYLSCLVTLLAAFYDETKELMGGGAKMRHFLVFSERNPDGRIMTEGEYREFTKNLKKAGDWSDLRTHIAVEIDTEMIDLTNQVLMVEKKRAS